MQQELIFLSVTPLLGLIRDSDCKNLPLYLLLSPTLQTASDQFDYIITTNFDQKPTHSQNIPRKKYLVGLELAGFQWIRA